MNNTVDIYVRLSDEDRGKKSVSDESESIQNQKKMLIEYCNQKGWHINAIYSDDDYSGADSSRPGWNLMLRDCKEGRCNIVICKTLSRFSRDMEMVEKYIHGKFKEWGVRFVSVVDNNDTEIKENKKSRQINGLINEWYLDDLSDNIKATLAIKRKNGEFVGSFAPYGYIPDPNNKNRLVIDPVAAEVVKRIFAMYINGFGYIAIAKALNADMISPPCERKKELGLKYYNYNYEKSYTSKKWSEAAIYAIIRRREYTGALVQGKQTVVNYKTGARRNKSENEWDIVEGMHEAIISKEDFQRAEKLRLLRGRGQKIPSGECYPLAGKVFCGECGNTMWKTSYAVAGKRHAYLSCRTHKIADNMCGNKHQIRTDILEKIIAAEINSLIEKYYQKSDGKLEEKIKAYKSSYNSKDVLFSELEEQNNAVRKINERLALAYTDKLDGIITAEDYGNYSMYLNAEKEKHEKRIEILKEKINAKKEKNDLKKSICEFDGISRLSSEIADLFIDKIYIYDKNTNNERKIQIIWKI